MTLQQTPAIVLKVFDYGESDKIVIFISPLHGKLTGIAKGAKRSSKRFVNKLELFSWLDLWYSSKNHNAMAQVLEAELLDSFITLRNDYDRYVTASLLSELVVNWSRENDADEPLFSLLLWALRGLNSGRPPLPLAIFFQMKLLTIVGYRPYLSGCIKCNRLASDNRPYRFIPSRNGLVCARCLKDTPSLAPVTLSMNTIQLLRNAQDLPLEKLNRLRFSRASTKEALVLLKQYGEYLLQQEIHSWTALSGY